MLGGGGVCVCESEVCGGCVRERESVCVCERECVCVCNKDLEY